MSKKMQWGLISFLVGAACPLINLLMGEWFYSSDTTNLFYVAARWATTELTKGEWPFWNEFLFLGSNQAASPALGLFSPLQLPFFLIFDGYSALMLSLSCAMGLAGLGAYLLAGQYVKDARDSFLIACIFVFSGFLLSLFDRSPIFIGTCLYPWFLFFLVSSIKEQLGRPLGLTVCIGLMFWHGDWIGAAFCFGFASLYIITTRIDEPRRSAKTDAIVLLSLLLGIGLGAISILPTLAEAASTRRGLGFSFEQTSYFSLHPLRLIEMFVPNLFGQVFDGSFKGQELANALSVPRFWYHSIYIGAGVLLMGLFGLFKSGARYTSCLIAGLSLFVLVLAFGSHSFLHEALYSLVKPYQGLRYPEKYIIYFALLMYLSFVVSWERVRSQPFFSYLLLAFGGIHVLGLVLKLAGEQLAVLSEAWAIATPTNLAHIVFAGVWGLLFLAHKKKVPSSSLALAVLVFELILFAPATLTKSSEGFAAKPFTSGSKGRLLLDLNVFNLNPKNEESFSSLLRHNWGSLSGVSYVFGYDTNVPGDTDQLIQVAFRKFDRLQGPLNIEHVLTTLSPVEKNLKKWASQGLVKPSQLLKESNAAVLSSVEPAGPVRLYNNWLRFVSDEAALSHLISAENYDREVLLVTFKSKAALVAAGFDLEPKDHGEPDSSVEAVEPNVQEVRAPELNTKEQAGNTNEVGIVSDYSSSTNTRSVKVQLEKSAWLAFSQRHHKGWGATVDGKQVSLLSLNGGLNTGLKLSPGEHLIELKFEPPRFYLGLWVSVLCLLMAIVLAWAQRFLVPEPTRASLSETA